MLQMVLLHAVPTCNLAYRSLTIHGLTSALLKLWTSRNMSLGGPDSITS